MLLMPLSFYVSNIALLVSLNFIVWSLFLTLIFFCAALFNLHYVSWTKENISWAGGTRLKDTEAGNSVLP